MLKVTPIPFYTISTLRAVMIKIYSSDDVIVPLNVNNRVHGMKNKLKYNDFLWDF